MRTASYIMASYQRPHIVGHAIDCCLASVIPDGWQLEIVVCAPVGDPGLPVIFKRKEIATGMGIDVVVCTARSGLSDVGSQFEAARHTATGELIMLCGDDDLQSPLKAHHAIKAQEAGALASGFNNFYFCDVDNDRLARWTGSAIKAGGTMSFDAKLLEQAGGWQPCDLGNDGMIHRNIAKLGIDLETETMRAPEEVGEGTVYLQHGANLSAPRPFPDEGEVFNSPNFDITGAGKWHDHDWPVSVRAALEACCK